MRLEEDISGKKFGKLTVLSRKLLSTKIGGRKRSHWLCRCDCGAEKYICGNSLRRGLSTSCGCYRRSPEFIGKLSSALLGRKISPESLRKRVLSQTGLKRSPEICKKFSAMQRGKVVSAAAKEKMRARKLNGPKFWLTEEHRKKLSIAKNKRVKREKAAKQSFISLLTG